MRLAAALLVLPVLTFALPEAATAQDQPARQRVAKRNLAKLCAKGAFANANPKTCAKYATNKNEAAPEQAKQPEQPSRPDFTQDDQNAAIIPGVPSARFWADSEKDFLA